jgi:diacylglycerol kinase family enzyme
MDPAMSRRDRINSRRRARLGNHLPHPHIKVQRGQSFSFSRQRSRESLRIDNELIPLWTAVHIEVKPDYWQVIV